ncbi:MAG: hypothetical protein JW986_00995 [Methanotrichaceae archaeon]|nr:hypothetical protein [Methanotrichaceae archaeon]
MREKAPLIAALVVVFAVILIIFPGGTAQGGTLGDSWLTPSDPQAGEILYFDNFSSSKSGWLRFDAGDVLADYRDMAYRITVVPDGAWWWCRANKNFTDFVMEIEATQISGPDDNAYGVVARLIDSRTFYMFLISGDGYYGFGALNNNTWVKPLEWEQSSAINLGNATNQIKLICKGDLLSFYANGVLLGEHREGTLSYGDVGLYVGSVKGGNVTVSFDDLRVWKLKRS